MFGSYEPDVVIGLNYIVKFVKLERQDIFILSKKPTWILHLVTNLFSYLKMLSYYNILIQSNFFHEYYVSILSYLIHFTLWNFKIKKVLVLLHN